MFRFARASLNLIYGGPRLKIYNNRFFFKFSNITFIALKVGNITKTQIRFESKLDFNGFFSQIECRASRFPEDISQNIYFFPFSTRLEL